MIIFIAIGSNIFTGAFLNAGCGQVITDLLLGMGLGRWGIFMVLLLIITVLGCFIDWIGILMIMVPIFAPILFKLQFDPLWVGLIVCVSLQISFLSPPFGYALFYLKGVAPPGVTTEDVYRGIVPFIALQLVGLTLCILFPDLITYLPGFIK
jgi:TRAP-type mannitol/chloroaromatic compound transport system permease large subunit